MACANSCTKAFVLCSIWRNKETKKITGNRIVGVGGAVCMAHKRMWIIFVSRA